MNIDEETDTSRQITTRSIKCSKTLKNKYFRSISDFERTYNDSD